MACVCVCGCKKKYSVKKQRAHSGDIVDGMVTKENWSVKQSFMTSDPEINANTWNEPAIQFTDFGFENTNTGPTNLDPQSVVLHICDNRLNGKQFFGVLLCGLGWFRNKRSWLSPSDLPR